MEASISSHVIIHIHSYQGQLIIGDKWQTITKDLHSSLKQHGIEDPRSSPNLLQFKFNHPFSALAAVLETLARVKSDHGWPAEQEPLPIQIVFHMDKAGELTPPIREASSDIWDFLEKERTYVTSTLKHQWNSVMSGRQIPEHSFESVGQGLYLLDLKGSLAIKTQKLFQHRDIFLAGQHPECFYCSMTSHEPMQCPAKFLPMNTYGLDLIGFLPFEQINTLAPEVFKVPEKFSQILADGVSPAEFRKSPSLILLTGFLDTNLIYQPRFLWQITFSSAAGWQDTLDTDSESLKIDSPAMQLGLDSLRVGNLTEAADQFEKELNNPKGQRKFYASAGMAFVHLEQNEEKYMEHYLNKAADTASLDKEIVYIKLLQARYLCLKNKLWEADQELKTALSTDRNCYEARYAMVRVAVRSGFGEKSISELQRLADSQQELFIATLLDPSLKPIQGLIEEMLFATAHNKAQSAANNLGNARNECEDLAEWLAENDPQLENNKNTLARLEKLYTGGSFYGLLEVDGRAAGLIHNCQRVRSKMNNELKERINRSYTILTSCETFWQKYPHQVFFTNFAAGLASARTNILQADANLEKFTGSSFAKARELLETSQKDLQDLRKSIERMISLKNFVETTRTFGKYLIISEVTSIIVVTVVLMLFSTREGSTIMGNPGFFRQTLTITALFIAPFLALGLTARKSRG